MVRVCRDSRSKQTSIPQRGRTQTDTEYRRDGSTDLVFKSLIKIWLHPASLPLVHQ